LRGKSKYVLAIMDSVGFIGTKSMQIGQSPGHQDNFRVRLASQLLYALEQVVALNPATTIGQSTCLIIDHITLIKT
jgi:hypothetical protein